jgi:hypothetical protein
MSESPTRSWARAGELAPVVFVSDVLSRYAKLGLVIPVFFWLTRSLPLPATADGIAQRSLSCIELIWPALRAQNILVKQQLGDAESARFGLFLLFLVISLALATFRMCVKARQRSADLRRTQATDFLTFAVVLVVVIYPLFGDTGGPKLLYDFVADRWGIFYFRQYLAFLGISWIVLAVVFYAIERLTRLANVVPRKS